MLEGVCGVEKNRSKRHEEGRQGMGVCVVRTASPESVFGQRGGKGEKGEKRSMQMSEEAVPGRGNRQLRGPEGEKEQLGKSHLSSSSLCPGISVVLKPQCVSAQIGRALGHTF